MKYEIPIRKNWEGEHRDSEDRASTQSKTQKEIEELEMWIGFNDGKGREQKHPIGFKHGEPIFANDTRRVFNIEGVEITPRNRNEIDKLYESGEYFPTRDDALIASEKLD